MLKKLVVDPKYGLVLIHIPIPHKPIIYKQAWWKNESAGYYKNLILSDIALGKIHQLMTEKGLWDNTTVIVTSDHWLRSGRPDHKKDQRVPFMIKLAGQNESLQYVAPFNTVLCHDLILAIMHKELFSANDLPKWLNNHKENYPLQPQIMPGN